MPDLRMPRPNPSVARALASLALLAAGPVCAQSPAPAPTSAPSFIPNFAVSVQNSGTPGIDGGTFFLWNGPSGFEPTPTLRVDRHVEAGTGKSGNTYKALWALGSTNPHNAGYEWTITGEMHNRALAETGAQNVAVNGTIFKEANGVGPVGPSWGGNFNCVDQTGEADPVASCIGLEVDVSTTSASTDKNRQRVGLQVSAGGPPGAHAGYGVLMGALPGSVIDRGISFQGEGSYGIGLDTTAARFSVAPIVMGGGQGIAFDGKPDGTFQRFLAYNGNALIYGGPGGAPFQVDDLGVVYASSVISAAPRPPSSSRSPCRVGQHAWDQNYEYRCVAENTWKRAALQGW